MSHPEHLTLQGTCSINTSKSSPEKPNPRPRSKEESLVSSVLIGLSLQRVKTQTELFCYLNRLSILGLRYYTLVAINRDATKIFIREAEAPSIGA
jgi:hypothetical protein